MSTVKDNYLQKLDALATSMEELCGLLEEDTDGCRIYKKNIVSVMNYVNQKVLHLSNAERKSINIANGKLVVLVSYVSCRLTFYQKRRLDFSAFPFMDTVVSVLLQFNRKASITSDSLNDLNKIIYVLSCVDKSSVDLRVSLSYRFLRLVVIFILYGNYCNASVLISFILEQLCIKGA